MDPQNNDVESMNSNAPMEIPEELKRDFSKLKVVELKEECRERGLPVSGTKAVLIERIQADVDEQIAELQRQHNAKARIRRPQMPGRINGDVSGRPPSRPQPVANVPAETEQYLEGLVREYLKASGGQAGSRDIGRYLATNADSGQGRNGASMLGQGGRITALSELKGLYGGLKAFILSRQDSFEKVDEDNAWPGRSNSDKFEFQVALRE